MNIDLKGKIALVTGATGELGRVMVRSLAECGADIAIHYKENGTRAEELADEIRSKGRKAVTVQADITSFDSIQRMGRVVVDGLGSPDIVVANAVIQIHPWTSVLQEAPEDYQSQLQSCIMQSVYLAKTFLPTMIEKKHGRFIAINTECSMEVAPRSSAYVAGKRGLDGVMRVLAKEVGEHQITVNQIAPGFTISDKFREIDERAHEKYIQTVPLKRRGTDQEIANVVVFIASELASFITGAYIPVCGGRIMPTI